MLSSLFYSFKGRRTSMKRVENQEMCATTQRVDGCRASDVFRSDESIIFAAEDELILCVSRQIGNLDHVVKLVIGLRIGTLDNRNLLFGDAAEIRFYFHEFRHAFFDKR